MLFPLSQKKMNKNKIIIAVAGSGKTTYLVNQALNIKDETVLITTYTRANAEEIRKKIKEKNNGIIPKNILVIEWFSFLLKDGVRPFKGEMNEELRYKHIGFHLSPEKSGFRVLTANHIPMYWGEDNFYRYYFTSDLKIHSDKISKFIYKCNEKTNSQVFERISNLYKNIFIDEIQDLAGWDLELLKLLFNSNSNILLVGDPRQTVYLTNNAGKHDKYKEGKIAEFINEECKKFNIIPDYETLKRTHRNNKTICDISSLLYPEYPKSEVCDCIECRKNSNCCCGVCRENADNKGVYVIKTNEIESYKEKFKDKFVVLNYDSSVEPEINFGKSKGSNLR